MKILRKLLPSLILLSATILLLITASFSQAGAFAVPKDTSIPNAIETYTPTSISTSTPTPTVTRTRTRTPTITLTSTPTPTGPVAYTDWALERFGPPWEIDCDDDLTYNGYRLGSWSNNFCVPGMLTNDAIWYKGPSDFFGVLTSYADGIMRSQVAHRGYDPDKIEGVALTSCANVDEDVWLRIPGVTGWEGPFKVVDCSQSNHLYYHMVGLGLAAEVSYKQALKWGMLVAPRIDVHVGEGRPGGTWNGERLSYWWVVNALEWKIWKPGPNE